MTNLEGIFAASITPLKADFSPDLDAIPGYLNFLALRGCHGALLLGTTGEGPSFSFEQRTAILRSAVEIRQDWPDFFLLAGTGTPSMDETVKLTRFAFEIGLDGTVVLPPYYFRDSDDSGILAWYLKVINRSVPAGGNFLVYNIPGVSGVPISIELLSHLSDIVPNKFSGLKDSSGNMEYAQELGQRFGENLIIFTGNDRLLSFALTQHASGCITAMANLISPDLRALWDAIKMDSSSEHIQERIDRFRAFAEQFTPFPPLIKYLLNCSFDFPFWPVCPPLRNLSPEEMKQVSTMVNLA